MAYYDALIAAWNGPQPPAGVTGTALTSAMTTQQKWAAVNGWTVAGPKKDVPVADVEAYLSLRGLLSSIEAWQKANPVVAGTVPTNAQIAATELMRTINSPHVSVFRMSDAATYTAVENLLNALAASPPALLSAQNVTDLLTMATGPTISWCQSNGYPYAGVAGGLNLNDAAAAGLS